MKTVYIVIYNDFKNNEGLCVNVLDTLENAYSYTKKYKKMIHFNHNIETVRIYERETDIDNLMTNEKGELLYFNFATYNMNLIY